MRFSKYSLFLYMVLFLTAYCQAQTSFDENKPKASALFQRSNDVLKLIRGIQDSTISENIPIEVATSIDLYNGKARYAEKLYRSARIQLDERLFKKLGAIPATYDLENALIELNVYPAEPYYDLYQNRFFVPNWLEVQDQESAMAREFSLALQRQRFDLSAYLDAGDLSSDALLARKAAVWGKATGVSLSYHLGGAGSTFSDLSDVSNRVRDLLEQPRLETAEFNATPAFVRELFLFPFVYGAGFTGEVTRRVGWQNLDIIFVDPPTSTEQILHPEKYIDIEKRDNPKPISIPDLKDLLRSWKPVHSMVLGEFRTFLLINEYDRALARSAGEGWEGDRVTLYEDGSGQELLVFLSNWENSLDTRQFYNGYRAVIEGKYPDAALINETTTALTWQAGDSFIHLVRRGNYVLILEGVPEGLIIPLYTKIMPVSR